MTRKRNDGHSTEFGLWLREQKEIASTRDKGFIATNLDFVWSNYLTGEWMLLEEKRYGRAMTRSQAGQFEQVDDVCKFDMNYKGFHLITFENTSPDDGWIRVDTKKCTKEELIEFLSFKMPPEWYVSMFEKYGY